MSTTPTQDTTAPLPPAEEEAHEPPLVKEDEVIGNSNLADLAKPRPILDVPFKPGDHVIRWKMLPIAWPIQIHGIVLNVHEGSLVLVDFGLTAVEEKDPETKKRSSLWSRDPKETEQALTKALDPCKGKQRLTLRVLAGDEIQQWKKVNYDGGFLGFGGGADTEGGAGEEGDKKKKWWKLKGMSSSTQEEEGQAEEEMSPKSLASLKRNSIAFGNQSKRWLKTVSQKFQKPPVEEPSTISAPGGTATTETVDVAVSGSILPPQTEDDSPAFSSDQHKEQDSSTTVSSPPSSPLEKPSEELVELSTKSRDEASEGESPRPRMNAAMANLMQKKKRKSKFGFADTSTDDATTATATTEGEDNTKQVQDLPKADPRKLVLARTRWLLQHGEKVLPPYHVFHANSENMAVWCKTGYWRGLQADVFLHSTAIGNAKSMGLATVGVAASVPLLAPVVGVAGLAMVGAPWLMLAKGKEKGEEFTQQLTDMFWEQAEPEVFVECIEHWTFRKDKKVQKDKEDETTTAEVSNPTVDEAKEGDN